MLLDCDFIDKLYSSLNEEFFLLGYKVMYSLESQSNFPRNMSPTTASVV
jgi:hypothetical protein